MDVDENFNIDEKKTIEFIKKETCLRNGETINLKQKESESNNDSSPFRIHKF